MSRNATIAVSVFKCEVGGDDAANHRQRDDRKPLAPARCIVVPARGYFIVGHDINHPAGACHDLMMNRASAIEMRELTLVRQLIFVGELHTIITPVPLTAKMTARRPAHHKSAINEKRICLPP